MGDFLRDKDPSVVGVLASIVGEKVTFTKPVVLDYRNNGGGILQEAEKIDSMFVPSSSIPASLMWMLSQPFAITSGCSAT